MFFKGIKIRLQLMKTWMSIIHILFNLYLSIILCWLYNKSFTTILIDITIVKLHSMVDEIEYFYICFCSSRYCSLSQSYYNDFLNTNNMIFQRHGRANMQSSSKLHFRTLLCHFHCHYNSDWSGTMGHPIDQMWHQGKICCLTYCKALENDTCQPQSNTIFVT